MKDNFVFRLRVVYSLLFFVGLTIIARLFFVQVVRGKTYRNMASGQYIAPTADYFDRGSIFFQKKDENLVSAATVKRGYVLAIIPKEIEDVEKMYSELSAIVDGLDRESFLVRANKKDDPYEEIAHKLTEEQAEQIQKMDIDGIRVFVETWRSYPAGSLASRVLGFVGFKDNKLVGRYGLERFYEDILRKDGEGKIQINAFAEIFLDIKEAIGSNRKKGDIVLTIDPVVQSSLEKILGKIQESYDAEMSGGIIMDPQTGRILAMSAKPNFDPNIYGQVQDMSLFFNPSVESMFEVGSIIKPLTLSAAIDRGVITSETSYYDKGYVMIEGEKIKNHDEKERGTVNMQDVLNNSLNNGAVLAMQKLGKENFKKYILDFGLGEETGIDLPNEISGNISNLDSKREIEYATASFGQGIAVTPIAMILALSSLANGGNLIKPFVVDKIITDGGIETKTELEVRRNVLKKETAEEITRMLVKAVDEALLGGTIKLEHYSVAAKTGTAQMYNKNGKGYSKDRYLHTFFGYAPAFDAKFVTLLFLVNPRGAESASYTLPKPFMEMTKFLLNYYEIPPDR